jgi:hypothetical protein
MLSLGCPSTIHSAAYLPAPPPKTIPKMLKPARGHPRHRTHQTVSVRSVAIGSVDHALDPGVGERGDSTGGIFEHRLQSLEIGRQQAGVEILGDAVERPGPGIALERAHEQTAGLLAHVERRVGIPEYWKLGLESGEGVDLLGDQVVVLERNDRKLDTDQTSDLPRPLTGCVDDDVRADLALRGLDAPARPFTLDRGHRCVSADLGSAALRTLCECMSHSGRVDVAVRRHVGRAEDAG